MQKSVSGSQSDQDHGKKKGVVCHNCGEPGHIHPNCPHIGLNVWVPLLLVLLLNLL